MGSGNPESFHTMVVHQRPAHSALSKETTPQNYRGFLNLALLLLAVNNLRLVVENHRKYGVLLGVPGRTISTTDLHSALLILGILCAGLLASLLIESLALAGLHKSLVIALSLFNLACILVWPGLVTWLYIQQMVMGVAVLACAVVLAMKLASYHLVNYHLRREWKSETHPVSYPEQPYPTNIGLGNLTYFWLAPTLCYQPAYPRSPPIRWRFLLKRASEVLLGISMIYFLLEQYAVPTVLNSIKPLQENDLMGIMERVMKLSLTNLYIWLVMFYTFFHSYLNVLAELLCFGDREFYSTWWNAATIDEYWRLWNIPVHVWLKRHVYLPLRARGVSSLKALSLTFLLSALVHEYLVGIPAHIVSFWVFDAMMFQIPSIIFTRMFRRWRPQSSLGNCFFWCSFCLVGQPACVIMYYREYLALARDRGFSQ